MVAEGQLLGPTSWPQGVGDRPPPYCSARHGVAGSKQYKSSNPNGRIMMSWKVEVKCDGEWSSNALRFATKAEAEASGKELRSRWYVPSDSRGTESTDPVNYLFDFDNFKNVRIE